MLNMPFSHVQVYHTGVCNDLTKKTITNIKVSLLDDRRQQLQDKKLEVNMAYRQVQANVAQVATGSGILTSLLFAPV
ncbi:hypothetical protein KSZ_42210 [Dictyobacter formicarum]|uniref:Uncharacterized protein n=1 Tax=Dictyobacter formicarum TaxID=2778368 RepID=A0ABQ3VJE4_9CHLR|nr:hypothetical protein KSZ_42210 [Dictyobacter formicarum]